MGSGGGLFLLIGSFVGLAMPPFARIFIAYDQARAGIADGDLLLFRRRGPIAIAGRGEHSHAAKAAWWDDDLFCLEMREWKGGRAVTLSSQVRRFPGRIDVFATNPDGRWPHYDRAASVRMMRRLAGTQYGYAGVLAAAWLHLPIVRWFVTPDVNDRAGDTQAGDARPMFCSQACAAADRVAGRVDPVPHLADRLASLQTVRSASPIAGDRRERARCAKFHGGSQSIADGEAEHTAALAVR